jgi:phosphoglycerol transferase MdoB-like AlkP superfamily enzyme
MFVGLPPLLRASLALIALQIALGTVMRLVFHLLFGSTGHALVVGDAARAFWLGLRFDLRLAILGALPLMLLGSLPPLKPRIGSAARRAWVALFSAIGVAEVLVYAVDLGHYDYLHERLDAAVLNELMSPREAAGMVFESYPIASAIAGLAVFVLLWRAVVRLALARYDGPAGTGPTRRWSAALFWAIALLGLYGNLSFYPLRWSQAYFSTDRYLSALAINPILNFAETLATRRRAYDAQRAREAWNVLREVYGAGAPDDGSLSLRRWVPPRANQDWHPNLVVIHLESWAAFQTGAFGNSLDPSPRFDALCEESLLFTRFFVPSGPTARSVFSMLTGLPDTSLASPVRSASRIPAAIDQHVLINALEGYERHYFLGGSANWANIRGLLQGNIDALVIHEEGDYAGRERSDVWGVSDLVLLETAIDVFDGIDGPFFAFLQTSGNHRPYTIPEYRAGFEPTQRGGIEDERLAANGFKDLESFDGFRFLDHCVGRFFELARARPWYRDTIFVLYGDHGVPAVHGIPYEDLGLTLHHVPMVLHAPRLTLPRRMDEPASSLDILPTALSLMGVGYRNSGLGRDLLDLPPERRFAWIANGLVLPGRLFRIDPMGTERLFELGGPTDRPCETTQPEERRRARLLYDAVLEWSRWALYHNPPQPHTPLPGSDASSP